MYSTGGVYLNSENSCQCRAICKSVGRVWNPVEKIWHILVGRNLRRACNGGWIMGSFEVFVECMSDVILRRHYRDVERDVICPIRTRINMMRQRRSSRDLG